MNEHIKLFETHSDYEEYINSQDKILPNVSFCKDSEEVHYNEKPHDYSEDYLTFVAKENGTFTFSPNNNNVISYSTDNGITWTEGNNVTVSNGDKVMWKGTMTPASSQGIGKFSSTANFDVQGNVMSLLYGTNFKGQTDLTGKDWAFTNLFQVNKKVVNAKNLLLPATTLANECYQYMFIGCTNLTIAPKLPATTLTNSCYYYMFEGCTSLTTAPELPAETLAKSCYEGMFGDCTNLTTAPELSAITLANKCYSNMFSGCTNLNYIKAMFTTTPSIIYTSNWVNGVSATGTFVKNSAATWTVTGTDGIPTGWEVISANNN